MDTNKTTAFLTLQIFNSVFVCDREILFGAFVQVVRKLAAVDVLEDLFEVLRLDVFDLDPTGSGFAHAGLEKTIEVGNASGENQLVSLNFYPVLRPCGEFPKSEFPELYLVILNCT